MPATGQGQEAVKHGQTTVIQQEPLRVLAYDTESLAFSPRGEQLAACGRFGDVFGTTPGDFGPAIVWNTTTWKSSVVLKTDDRSGEAECLAYSPKGTLLAIGPGDGTVQLLNTHTWQARKLQGYLQEVKSVAFSPDGLLLAESSFPDAIIHIWRVVNGQQCSLFRKSRFVITLRRSHDVAAIPHRLYVGYGWHVLLFSPNDKSLIMDGPANIEDLNSDTILVYDIATWHQRFAFTLPTAMGPSAAALSPDGKILAVACYLKVDIAHPQYKYLTLWDIATGRPIRALPGYTDPVDQIAFSPNGKLLAMASIDLEIQRDTHLFPSWPYLPNYKIYASAKPTLRFWDTRTWRLVRRVHLDSHHITAISFSPNGKTIATADFDQTIKIWSVPLGYQGH